jgi:hypothetical protein
MLLAYIVTYHARVLWIGLANYSFEVIHANYKFNLNKIINLNKCTSTTSSVGLVCKLRDTKF